MAGAVRIMPSAHGPARNISWAKYGIRAEAPPSNTATRSSAIAAITIGDDQMKTKPATSVDQLAAGAPLSGRCGPMPMQHSTPSPPITAAARNGTTGPAI